MSGALYPHQEFAGQRLSERLRDYLGDAPGLGKTRSLIHGAQLSGSRKVLVMCPAIARTHWLREFKTMEWDGDPISIYSYDAIVRGGDALQAEILTWNPDTLILDEAHFLKNIESLRTRRVFGKLGYARCIKQVWAASGTPMPKHPGEMGAVMLALFPDQCAQLGITKWRQWFDRFCVYSVTQYGPKVHAVKNAHELRALLDAVMLRRKLSDVDLKLPSFDWQTLTLDGEKDLRISEMADKPELKWIAERLANGESLSDGPASIEGATLRRLIGEAKAPAAATHAADFLTNSNEKLVIFAYHRSVLQMLRERLKDFGVAYIDGDVGDVERNRRIDSFQNDEKTRVFVGQIGACQTGIDLTAASRCMLVEPEWTAKNNQQAGARIVRLTQNADRCIGQLVALADSLDEAIIRQNLREVRMDDEVFA